MYTPKQPKYPYTTEVVYKIQWPKSVEYNGITHYLTGQTSTLISTGAPCVTYESQGYGKYFSRITLDLEGNIYPRSTE